MKSTLLFAITLFLIFSLLPCQGQITLERQVIANAGDYFTNTNSKIITLSWTFGEAVIETVSSGVQILTQGFQQAEPEEIVSVEEISLKELGIKIFPNPTSMEVIIKVTKLKELPLNLQLFDLNGKILRSRKVTNPVTTLNVNDYADGVYIIRFITLDNKPIVPIKIQKISPR